MRRTSATGEAGFTLLELMLVVLVMGLLAVTVTLALPDSGPKRLQQEAERLRGVLMLAAEQAVYRNRDYGLLLQGDGYAVLRRDGESWAPLDEPGRLRARRLGEGIRVALSVGGQPVRLEDADVPQILILNDGQITPFELRLFLEEGTKALVLENGSGDLRLREPAP